MVFKFSNGNFILVNVDEGDCYVDFTAYDSDRKEIDGGQFDYPEGVLERMDIEDIVSEVVRDMNWTSYGDITKSNLSAEDFE